MFDRSIEVSTDLRARKEHTSVLPDERGLEIDSQNSGRSSDRLTTCFQASSKSEERITYLLRARRIGVSLENEAKRERVL